MTHFWHFLTISSPSVSPASVSFLIKFVWYPDRKSNTTFTCVILWPGFILLRLDLKSIYFSVFLWTLSWISPKLQTVPSNIMSYYYYYYYYYHYCCCCCCCSFYCLNSVKKLRWSRQSCAGYYKLTILSTSSTTRPTFCPLSSLMNSKSRLKRPKTQVETENERILVIDFEFDFLAELSPARLRPENCLTHHYHVCSFRSWGE